MADHKFTIPQKILLKETSRSREYQHRIKKGYEANPGGAIGVANEFNITPEQAIKMLKQGRFAPQDHLQTPHKITELMREYNFQPSVISKILNLYKTKKEVIKTHRPSPGDKVAFQQLENNERLAAMIHAPHIEQLVKQGYAAELVPWTTSNQKEWTTNQNKDFTAQMRGNPVYYISKHPDVLKELINTYHKHNGQNKELDLLQGLVFAYPMNQVYDFIARQTPNTKH